MGSAGTSGLDGGGARLPHAGLGVPGHAERRGIAAQVVDPVLVEEVEGGEGAVAGRAVGSFDAVPAVLAARAGHRQPGGFVFRHNRQATGPHRRNRRDRPRRVEGRGRRLAGDRRGRCRRRRAVAPAPLTLGQHVHALYDGHEERCGLVGVAACRACRRTRRRDFPAAPPWQLSEGSGMRIAVMGTGGVGGYFGARLARGGHDVAFVARGAAARGPAATGCGWRARSATCTCPMSRPPTIRPRSGPGRPGAVRGQAVGHRAGGRPAQAAARPEHRRGVVPERRGEGRHPAPRASAPST